MSNDKSNKVSKEWTHPHVHNHKKAIEEHLIRIQNEFRDGFALIHKYPRSVSIFGSAAVGRDNKYYKQCFDLSDLIVTELGYAIVNGGGPGIMEASCLGARNAHGNAVGLRIRHVREHTADTTATDSVNFTYFFVRKALLTFAAEAYVFFPGGFGTFDELFSVLTLIQTEKIPRVPVLLFGSEYWKPFIEFMKKHMLAENGLIKKEDLDLFEITDDPQHVLRVIKAMPTADWWRNLN